jgi:hypothetical protein
MMSKKSKRLYDRMQHGIEKKKESVNRLVAKREDSEIVNIKANAEKKRSRIEDNSNNGSTSTKKQKKSN